MSPGELEQSVENSVRGGAVLIIFSGVLLLVGMVALLGVWGALVAAGSLGSLVGVAVLHAGLTARFAQERSDQNSQTPTRSATL